MMPLSTILNCIWLILMTEIGWSSITEKGQQLAIYTAYRRSVEKDAKTVFFKLGQN